MNQQIRLNTSTFMTKPEQGCRLFDEKPLTGTVFRDYGLKRNAGA
jgi:hypothetical protein